MTRAERLASYGAPTPDPALLDRLNAEEWAHVLRAVRHRWEMREIGMQGRRIGATQHSIQASRNVARRRHLEEIKCSSL